MKITLNNFIFTFNLMLRAFKELFSENKFIKNGALEKLFYFKKKSKVLKFPYLLNTFESEKEGKQIINRTTRNKEERFEL